MDVIQHKLEGWMSSIRTLTKVSDDPRWNSVLFGGEDGGGSNISMHV